MTCLFQNRVWGVLGVAILAAFFILSCTQQKPRGTKGEDGSLGVSPGETPTPSTMFPHPDNWEAAASHGVWVVQNGSDACHMCHKKISTQKESTPTCSSCHPLYPHKDGWVGKDVHGASVKQIGTSSCATQCHGYDLKGGLSNVSCNLCHTTFPHILSWVNPGEHGAVAEGDGKKLCMGCHGDDLKGGTSGVSCTLCHANYPHESDWVEEHGELVIDTGKTACATQCHGLDLNGGLSGTSCNDCHDLYPHSDSWEEDHRETVLTLGLEACQDCHGEDLKKVLDGKNCFSCHPDYPHPEEETWLPYSGGHGERLREGYLDDITPCQGCHGSELQTLKDGQNCFSCHLSYPHDVVSKEILGFPPETQWKAYEAHGQWTLARSKEPCTVCHGSTYDGGSRGNASCVASECHANYPHEAVEGWKRDPGEPQEHGNYVQANTSVSCATARCHGASLIPEPGVSHGVNCSACHAAYPHEEGWISGLVHGPLAIASIAQCKTCHGSGLNVAPPGHQTCENCHPSYLQHQTAEMGVIGWDAYSGHGVLLLNPPYSGDMSECQLCHGADYLGGISVVSCRSPSCHPSFPHTQANWEIREGHGDYVHDTLPVIDEHPDFTACKLCHGNDLAGGHSGQSCIGGCHPNPGHPNYPHTVIAGWNNFEGHGAYVLTTLGNDKASCKICHGDTLTGGESGQTCYECHTSYPHLDGWKRDPGLPQDHGPPAYGDGKNTCNSANCHGVNFEGNPAYEIIQGCFDCHPGFPHTVPNWVAGLNSVHFTTFIQEIQEGNATACTECHGVNYDHVLGDKACTTCHPDGVTHTATWSQGPEHGTHFISAGPVYSSTSPNPNCMNCHGDPVAFTDQGPAGGNCGPCHPMHAVVSDQTQEVLVSQSTCYSCHWAYPHFSYDVDHDPGMNVGGWGPTINDVLPDENPGGFHGSLRYFGHLMYIKRPSPLSEGVETTCGRGSEGSCHNNNRAAGNISQSCGDYCHTLP